MSRAVEPPAPARRYCLRCDNRHGCRTAEAACLSLPRAQEEEGLAGKVLLFRHGRLELCRACSMFRKCWSGQAYRRALRQTQEEKGGHG